MNKVIRGCIACALMLMPTGVWAMHPLEVEDTGTEGRGNVLIEITGDYVKDNDLKSTKMTGVISVGVGEHTDLALEVPYVKLDPSPVTDAFASGKGDIRFKFKHQLFENEVKQSMAFQIYGDLPTGDIHKGLGTNKVVWGAMLIDTQECHDNAFHVNLGYEVSGRDVKKKRFADNYAYLFGFAAEHKLTSSFRVLTELAGERRQEVETVTAPFTFLTGVVYDISPSWYVDLGVRAGLNKYAEDHAVLAGTAWRF